MYDPKTGRTRETRDVIWLKWMFYQRPPSQREPTTESIMYDVMQEQNQDQDHDQEQDHDQANNQEVATQNDDTMQIVDDSTSTEDGEGHSNNDDQTEQSNNDEQESTQDDAAGLPQQPNKTTTTTSSGHAVQRPAWMDEYEMGMTVAESKYYEAMKELGCCTDDPEQQQHELGLMGARLGEGIANTRELKVLSYAEAMEQPDRPKWDKSVSEEHQ